MNNHHHTIIGIPAAPRRRQPTWLGATRVIVLDHSHYPWRGSLAKLQLIPHLQQVAGGLSNHMSGDVRNTAMQIYNCRELLWKNRKIEKSINYRRGEKRTSKTHCQPGRCQKCQCLIMVRSHRIYLICANCGLISPAFSCYIIHVIGNTQTGLHRNLERYDRFTRISLVAIFPFVDATRRTEERLTTRSLHFV